mgnify:CR=1 FL=1
MRKRQGQVPSDKRCSPNPSGRSRGIRGSVDQRTTDAGNVSASDSAIGIFSSTERINLKLGSMVLPVRLSLRMLNPPVKNFLFRAREYSISVIY